MLVQPQTNRKRSLQPFNLRIAMGKETKFITQAVAALAKAQAAMAERIDRHDKIIDSQAREITELQAQVLSIRNAAINTDLDAGDVGSGEVALKYDLSPGRVSQIRNS